MLSKFLPFLIIRVPACQPKVIWASLEREKPRYLWHVSLKRFCCLNLQYLNWKCIILFFFSLFSHPDYEIVSPYEVTHQGQYISHEVAHHHRRRRRSLTPDASLSDETVHFRLNGLGQEFHMELRETSDGLIAPGFTIQVLGKNGTKSLRAYQKHDLCFYQGSLRLRVNSSVALSTCTGMVSLNMHRIELLLWSLQFCCITTGKLEANVAHQGQIKTEWWGGGGGENALEEIRGPTCIWLMLRWNSLSKPSITQFHPPVNSPLVAWGHSVHFYLDQLQKIRVCLLR